VRLFIDIGHPAHVHYFRNFIKLMQEKGHVFLITARNKEVSHILLDKYEISYVNRGAGSKKMFGKLLYLFKADFFLFLKAYVFKPDLFISFASPYTAQVSIIMRRPHISLTDTDNARFGILSFAPFTKCIITPKPFKRDFGKKHLRIDSYMELFYLHPKYYTPDFNSILCLGVKENERYALLRFVSWGANHDIGQAGLTDQEKISITFELSKYLKVFISSESKLPSEIEHFRINVSPETIHDVLYFAAIYIGEGATMASECAMLGTPAIYINSLSAGTLEEQEKHGLLYSYRTSNGILEKAKLILSQPSLKEELRFKCKELLHTKIDVTAFLVWFIENYPKSNSIIMENQDYQYMFM
jgi:uncharacterized protein